MLCVPPGPCPGTPLWDTLAKALLYACFLSFSLLLFMFAWLRVLANMALCGRGRANYWLRCTQSELISNDTDGSTLPTTGYGEEGSTPVQASPPPTLLYRGCWSLCRSASMLAGLL